MREQLIIKKKHNRDLQSMLLDMNRDQSKKGDRYTWMLKSNGSVKEHLGWPEMMLASSGHWPAAKKRSPMSHIVLLIQIEVTVCVHCQRQILHVSDIKGCLSTQLKPQQGNGFVFSENGGRKGLL